MSKNTQRINTLEQLATSLKSDKQIQRVSPESSITRLSNEQYKSETRYFAENIKQAVETEKTDETKKAISWAKEEKTVDLGAFAREMKEATNVQETNKVRENDHEF